MKTIPEVRLIRARVAADGSNVADFKYAGADDAGRKVGHRNKLGGSPDWLHARDEVPYCKACAEHMTFYGQLDSINDDTVLADCGMIYIFVCFGCYGMSSVFQT